MDDLPNLLHRDYGLKPQGKAAPMAGSGAGASQQQKRIGNDPTGQAPNSFGGAGGHMNVYDDVFGGPPKFAAGSYQQDGGYDDIFRTFSAPIKNSAVPVFDTPVYDDEDIFGGVKGVRSGGVRYDDVFSGGSGAGVRVPAAAPPIEDLLGEGRVPSPREQGNLNLRQGGGEQGKSRISRYAGETRSRHWEATASPRKPKGNSLFYDPLQQLNMSSQPTSNKETKVSSNGMKGIDGINAFDGLPLTGRATSSPMNKARVAKSPSKTSYNSPTRTRGQTELQEGRSVKKSSGLNNFVRDRMKSHTSSKISSPRRHRQPLHENSTYVTDLSSRGLSPLKKSEKGTDVGDRLVTVDEIKLRTKPTTFPPPSRPPPPLVLKQGPSSKETLEASTEDYSHSTIHPNTFTVHQLQSGKASRYSSNQEHETFASGGSREKLSPLIDVMLEGSSAAAASTVAMNQAIERAETRLKLAKEAREKKREDWEREAKMAKSQEKERQNRRDERKLQEDWEREEKERPMKATTQEDHELEEKEKTARAAREAHEREEKEKATKAAQEAREREEKEAAAKAAREARAAREAYEREEKEKAAKAAQEAREREEKEAAAKAAREARERGQREREQQEKERRQREREREMEREKEREREREREKDRIAVERATKEARERAEKAAVERAAAEARERAERAAFERASGEARERAAAEAKERAAAERAAAERAAGERAATTVRERPAVERAVTERAEARIRAERAASERAMAEARERAAERAAVERVAAEARERAERAVAERAAAAAAARERQRRNENDLESFFGMASRSDSAAKQRPATSNVSGEVFQKATAGTPQSYKRSNLSTNTADDWTSLFTASSSDEFQEIPGETAERRRARWERHQRTLERAAKALAEKNDRDLQAQREQAERHRMAETLDADVKRWATGKEGNLRALLSTLQYILWPECGWQPVSLTDIIAAAAVKKVYRKATLCVHPDKVQQKGATIQQKYIAEKVFDLLKEAWNKFNSEELF